jgi:PAS domain S-box-containing protein
MDSKDQPIRILFAEDVPADAEMAKRELRKQGIPFIDQVTDTEQGFRKALDEFRPDIIISDYTMPGFSGLTALRITLEHSPEIPFIILTGSINEETAVECLKAGAVDYILKESLKRLGQAVSNSLEQRKIKEKTLEAEKRLRESEERFRRLAENAQDIVFRVELVPKRRYSYMNQAVLDITGFSPKEFYDDPNLTFKIIHPNDRHHLSRLATGTADTTKPVVLRWIKKDGKTTWTEQRNINISDESENLVAIEGIARDVTEQKLNEQKLIQREKEYRDLINGMNETVWIITPNGKLLDVNRRAVEVLGYSREELLEIGLPGIDHYLTNGEISSLTQSMEVNEFQFFHTWHTSKSGKEIPVEISSSPINYRGEMAILCVARDITERIRIEDKLRLLSRSVEQSPVAIVITDAKGNIEYVNPVFTKITGYSFAEIKGKNPRVLKSGHQSEKFYKKMWTTILSGKNWRGELKNKKKNGEVYWEEDLISPIMDQQGKITHFVAVKEDVTQKKKIMADLVAAKEKAEESDRLKSAFLANMSHEIRTPMNGIMGFTELLKEPQLKGKEKKKYIKIIQKSGERMLDTINDLIEISKVESGTVEVQYSHFNINEQIDYYYNFFKPEAEKKGLNLSFQKELSFDRAFIKSDKDKLNGILANLIKNAIKYTNQGNIEFGYCIKDNMIEFFVKDTGIGIEEARQKFVFDRFVQADMSFSKPYEGAGLGLSIAKAYADMLNGKIWLESEPEKGSQFFFTIPFK